MDSVLSPRTGYIELYFPWFSSLVGTFQDIRLYKECGGRVLSARRRTTPCTSLNLFREQTNSAHSVWGEMGFRVIQCVASPSYIYKQILPILYEVKWVSELFSVWRVPPIYVHTFLLTLYQNHENENVRYIGQGEARPHTENIRGSNLAAVMCTTVQVSRLSL
jgi:hypothetical protein